MKRIQTTLILVFLAGTMIAQENLSLTDAIAKALENNYDMIIVRQNQEIAEINNDWGAAGRYPYINLSAGNNNTLNNNETLDFTENRFSSGLSLNWTLFDGFSVKINKARFEELETLSKQNTAIMVEGTIQSVVLAYYSVLLEKERLQVLQELMELSEDRFKQAEQRKEFGSSVTFDVLQAKNAFLSDKTNFLSQEVAYKNALRDLKYLMAVKDPLQYNLTNKFEAQAINYKVDDLKMQLKANNKTLKNQYVNQNLLENAVAASKSMYYPSLSLVAGGNYNKNRYNPEGGIASWANSNSMYGNLTLSYNLFSGGNRKRALQIAQIQEESGQIQVQQMTHELENKLDNLYEFYLVRKELLMVADENLEAAKLNLQIAEEKFESGAINSFNYRDIQLTYLNVSQAKLQAIYNFIDTHTSLLRMTGTIIQEMKD